MVRKMFFFMVFISFAWGEGLVADQGSCVTKEELIKILKGIFPENKNLQRLEGDKPELYAERFGPYSSDKILSRLRYYYKNGDEHNVLIRCDYLLTNRTLGGSDRVELLNICSEYEAKQYQYDTAILYLEELLDINNGDIKTKDIIKRMIYLYEKKGDVEKVRYFKNIIND